VRSPIYSRAPSFPQLTFYHSHHHLRHLARSICGLICLRISLHQRLHPHHWDLALQLRSLFFVFYPKFLKQIISYISLVETVSYYLVFWLFCVLLTFFLLTAFFTIIGFCRPTSFDKCLSNSLAWCENVSCNKWEFVRIIVAVWNTGNLGGILN
jgi:hypothetical protein